VEIFSATFFISARTLVALGQQTKALRQWLLPFSWAILIFENL
jgi:hypothetical protein